MAIIACEHRITCPECFDPPVLNLSAERPDPAVHFGIDYGGGPGPIGSYGAQGCKSWVWSSVSQERANMLAAAQSALCDDPCPVPPCDDDPCLTPPCPPIDGDGDGTGGGNYFATADCSINCPDGTAYLYSAPADAGVSSVSQQEADAFATSVCEQQAHLRQICFSNMPACTCYGGLPVSWSWTITATGGTPPYTFYPVTGLPPNFTLDPTGILSGILNAAGVYSVPIQVVDVDGNTNTKTFDIVAVEIVTTVLPAAAYGVAYSTTLASNPPGVGVWVIVSGALPAGLTLAATTGVISGTPTETGSFSVKIGLVHPSCTGTLCARDYTLTIAFWASYAWRLNCCTILEESYVGNNVTFHTHTLGNEAANSAFACSDGCGGTTNALVNLAAISTFGPATVAGTCLIHWSWDLNVSPYTAWMTNSEFPFDCISMFLAGTDENILETRVNTVLVDTQTQTCAGFPGGINIGFTVISRHINAGDTIEYRFFQDATSGHDEQWTSATFEFVPD